MKNKGIKYYAGCSILLSGLIIGGLAIYFDINEKKETRFETSSSTVDNNAIIYSGYLGVKEAIVTCEAAKRIDDNGNVVYTVPAPGYVLLGSTCYKKILTYQYPIETYDNNGNLIYVVDEGYEIKKFENIDRNDITLAIAASEDEMETETLVMGK